MAKSEIKIVALRFVRCFDVINCRMVNHFDAATDGEILSVPMAMDIAELIRSEDGFNGQQIEDFKEKWIRYVLQNCHEDISQNSDLLHWPHQTEPFVNCRVLAGSEVRR